VPAVRRIRDEIEARARELLTELTDPGSARLS
jgi:hypothetical protein